MTLAAIHRLVGFRGNTWAIHIVVAASCPGELSNAIARVRRRLEDLARTLVDSV